MSDTPDPLETFSRPLKLANLRQVRNAMATVINEIRDGTLPVKPGNAVLYGLNVLSGCYQDARDNLYKRRLKALWQAHQAATGAKVEPMDPDSTPSH